MWWKAILISMLGVLYLSRSSYGCSCYPTHPQNSICTSDFAIKGTPVFAFYIPFNDPTPFPVDSIDDIHWDTVIYKVRVDQVFKGSPDINEDTYIQIRTAGDSARCGMRLMTPTNDSKISQPWLLTGSYNDGVYRINSCGWNEKWNDVSTRQGMYLENEYLQNCECEVRTCYPEGCQKFTRSTKGCRWRNPSLADRYYNKKYCKYCSQSGKCRWTIAPRRHSEY